VCQRNNAVVGLLGANENSLLATRGFHGDCPSKVTPDTRSPLEGGISRASCFSSCFGRRRADAFLMRDRCNPAAIAVDGEKGEDSREQCASRESAGREIAAWQLFDNRASVIRCSRGERRRRRGKRRGKRRKQCRERVLPPRKGVRNPGEITGRRFLVGIWI